MWNKHKSWPAEHEPMRQKEIWCYQYQCPDNLFMNGCFAVKNFILIHHIHRGIVSPCQCPGPGRGHWKRAVIGWAPAEHSDSLCMLHLEKEGPSFTHCFCDFSNRYATYPLDPTVWFVVFDLWSDKTINMKTSLMYYLKCKCVCFCLIVFAYDHLPPRAVYWELMVWTLKVSPPWQRAHLLHQAVTYTVKTMNTLYCTYNFKNFSFDIWR